MFSVTSDDLNEGPYIYLPSLKTNAPALTDDVFASNLTAKVNTLLNNRWTVKNNRSNYIEVTSEGTMQCNIIELLYLEFQFTQPPLYYVSYEAIKSSANRVDYIDQIPSWRSHRDTVTSSLLPQCNACHQKIWRHTDENHFFMVTLLTI